MRLSAPTWVEEKLGSSPTTTTPAAPLAGLAALAMARPSAATYAPTLLKTAIARAPGTERAPFTIAALCASLFARTASTPSSSRWEALCSQTVKTSATGEPG
jgi:hypothetical protein